MYFRSTFPRVYLRAETARGGPPSRPRALQRGVAISACGAPALLRGNALPRTPYVRFFPPGAAQLLSYQ